MHKISMTVNEACKATGLGRTSLYQLIKDGAITKRKLGGRTIILVNELEAYINSLPIEDAIAA